MAEPKTLVVADVNSTTERGLIRRWAAKTHPGAPVVEVTNLTDDHIRQDVAVQPVRVTWLPKERASGNPLSPSELLLLAQPRRPWRPWQQILSLVRPDAAKVTVAEPATAAELRGRFTDRYQRPDQTGADQKGLGTFVGRQAIMALDRAERGTLGTRYKVPRLIAEQIMDKPGFQADLENLAVKLDRDTEAVTDDAGDALEELVAVQSPLALELFRSILRPMHAKAWDVDADSGAFDRLRELNRSHSLVFLPSHRSYVDPLILGDVLLDHDMPPNHTLGGDNLSFWPFGTLGRRAGIVFIRRSFGGDEVYKQVVRHYLAHLMAKRFNLEWFMEGGRTRTGKLRQPRYGILTYLVDALDLEPGADPVLVPVSLVYEQLHEVSEMAAEEQGGAKQTEGLAWTLRYLRSQREHLGRVAVRFGDPLPLRQALVQAGGGPSQLQKVAFRVAARINEVTPATATSLVTLVLLGERDRALTPQQILRRIRPLLDYLDAKGVERPRDDLRDQTGLHATLTRLADAGVVEVYDQGTTPVWSVRPGRHHTAAFYRNGALHHLLIRAIVELTLLHVATLPDEEDHLAAAWREALRIRDLLKFEFYFAPKPTYRTQLQSEALLIATSWETSDLISGQARRLLQRVTDGPDADPSQAGADVPVTTGPLVAHHVLRSFLDAQLVATEVLVALGDGRSITAEQLVADCLALGKQMVRQRRIHGVESVSRELFTGCAGLADNRELLHAGVGAQQGRAVWREELMALIARLDIIHVSQAGHGVAEE